MVAVDDKGNAVDLSTLEPGEEMVRVLRGTLRYVPDHIAVARANHALCCFTPAPGTYRDHVPNKQQVECLTGDA